MSSKAKDLIDAALLIGGLAKAVRELYAELARVRQHLSRDHGEDCCLDYLGPIGRGDLECDECHGVGLVGPDGTACVCVRGS